MKTTKTITKAALLSAVILGSVNAEFKLTDELSVSGYIDLSATYTPDDGQTDSFNTQVQEVEVAFAFNPKGSKYSALVELAFVDNGTNANGSDNRTDFETATVTYTVNDALSFSVGNIYTYQGFESFDAPGLYQFSFAGRQNSRLYSADYAFGIGADYVKDDYGFGLWIGEGTETISYEILAQYTAIENLTLKAIYADDRSYETINLWASYEYNDFTFAVEYVDTDNEGSEDLEALVGLVNYSWGNAGVTFRYTDAQYGNDDFEKYTISPSYTFSNNLSGLLEYSEVRDDSANGDGSEYAAELIFTF